MIKLYYKALLKPLSLLSNHFIDSNTFRKTRKKSNVCSIHKKGGKQTKDQSHYSPSLVKH